jgi:DNA-binding NarL/FixJ family response regulator
LAPSPTPRAGADPKLGADDLEALEQLTEPVTLARVAGMAWGLGHHHLARRLRSRAVRLARTRGAAAGSLAWVLLSVVTDNLEAGRFGIAEADAEEEHRLVEAAARAGEPAQAAEPLAQFHAWAATTNAPELQALAARCRALLATGDTAIAEFETAPELHTLTNRPTDQARTQLLAGEHLRRARRRADARQHLRAAVETFARLDAAAWAERARAELRAAGEATPRPAPTRLAALTPQELRIAAAVSEGASNRQIAAQLFLSPRTVDYHLRKVFPEDRDHLTRRARPARPRRTRHLTDDAPVVNPLRPVASAG